MYIMASPSPYPYPSLSPSSQPFSFTPTPGSLASASVASASVASASVASASVASASVASASPHVYLHMPSYSPSPIGLPIYASNKQNILSHVSDDAFYGIICAIVFLILYSSIHALYYYNKYKKEKLRLKRLNEISGKVHSSVLNPAYPD